MDIKKTNRAEHRPILIIIEVLLLIFIIGFQIFDSTSSNSSNGPFSAMDNLGTDLVFLIFWFIAIIAFIIVHLYLVTTFKKPYNIILLIITIIVFGIIGCIYL